MSEPAPASPVSGPAVPALRSASLSMSASASARRPSASLSEMNPADPNRNKQSDVRILAMPSSSPTLPSLSSGSSTSPSISSVDTTSSAAGRGPVRVRADQVQNALSPVITSRSAGPAAGEGPVVGAVGGTGTGGSATTPSRASSSSWSTPAPSLPCSGPDSAPAATVAAADIDSRMYTCLFHMLDCHDSFDDAAQWRTHVLSHFRTHPPPQTARCPLCPDTTFTDNDGQSDTKDSPTPASVSPAGSADEDSAKSNTPSSSSTTPRDPRAWDRMLDHVANDHYQRGQTLAGSRPDFELMRYLYGRRIISDAQFKAMQLAPAPSSPAYHRSQDGVRASIGSSDEPYCAPYSRRREERMRGQTRGVSVV